MKSCEKHVIFASPRLRKLLVLKHYGEMMENRGKYPPLYQSSAICGLEGILHFLSCFYLKILSVGVRRFKSGLLHYTAFNALKLKFNLYIREGSRRFEQAPHKPFINMSFDMRLVIPNKYAYKSPKWIRKIKFTSQKKLGYWSPEDTATMPIHGKRKDIQNKHVHILVPNCWCINFGVG